VFLASIPIPCDIDCIDMATVTVSPKYQIVIPKDVRDRLVMVPGDKIEGLPGVTYVPHPARVI
jgi:hypothetical protein